MLKLLGLIFIVFANIQTIFSIEVGVSLKPFHFVMVFLLSCLLYIKQLRTSKLELFWWGIFLLLFYVCHSIFAYLLWGWNALVLNYLLCVLSVFCSYSVAFLYVRPIELLKSAALIVFFMVFVKLIIFHQDILAFLGAPYGHPSIMYFYGGGPNIEATWLGLFLSFFLMNRIFYVLALFLIVISFLYASRVGLIVVFSVIAFKIFLTYGFFRFFAASCCMMFIVLIFFASGDFYLIERFSSIGDDQGSVGRINLWVDSFASVLHNPFGYGAGNAVSSLSYSDYIEDNVHNYMLQVIMDFGLVGLLLWLLFYSLLIRFALHFNSRQEYLTFFVVYFIASMVQFRGGDAMFWIVFGVMIADFQYPNKLEIFGEGAGRFSMSNGRGGKYGN